MINFLCNKLIILNIAITAILIFWYPDIAISETVSSLLFKFEGHCNHGVQKQPNGAMAVINFCEGALGTYIGLVYYDPMGAPVPIKYHEILTKEERENYFKVWSLGNRMWQESQWASDVTSYAWGPKGTRLFVATSNIYGSGALYELDLIRRKYKQIAPEGKRHSIDDPGPGFLITKINKEKLFYQLSPWDLPPGAIVKEKFYEIGR